MTTTKRGTADSPADQFPDFLDGDAETVARALLGCELARTFDDGSPARVRIVETEAYDQNDPASHAFHGRSARNDALFGPAGHLYVYFTYGMHYCANIACSDDGFGAGALVRAVEPIEGAEILEERRGMTGVNITNGPAKLCKALDIDKRLYAHDLHADPLRLIAAGVREGEKVAVTPRIGISKATDWPRRFIIEGNPYVSKSPMNAIHL